MITTSDVQDKFKDLLSLINDADLKQKVIETWVEGCREGGWNAMEELDNMPFTLLTKTEGISFIEHTIAVTKGALGLLNAQLESYDEMPYPVDQDVLIAGGLLHDVGKLLEIEPDGAGGFRKSYNGKLMRHPISGAVLAARNGIKGPVLNTIVCHAKEGDGRPQCFETILIHQADFATFNPLVMKEKKILIEEENQSY